MWPFQTVTDLRAEAEIVRRRPYGVIEMVDGRLRGIHFRPWPKVVSVAEIWLFGGRFHHRTAGDCCLLYFNQPWGHRNYLTLSYIVSSSETNCRTARGAMLVLDEVARIKQSDAVLCEVRNVRISDRLLRRWGWERHVLDSPSRHYIKRFYGEYPPPAPDWALCAAEYVPSAGRDVVVN